MKKIIYLSVLICGIISCSNDDLSERNNSWIQINKNPYNGLTDVEFYNDDFGLISGWFGTLLKTEDGGESWQELDVSINATFLKTFILNENEFFTSRGGLYKTTNGGNSFNELSNLSDYAGAILGIHFFDSNEGVIYKEGNIFKTTDGGNVWDITYTEAGFASTMQFVSKDVGFISGGITNGDSSIGEIHRTIDSGITWNFIDIALPEIMSMYFLDEDLGYIADFERQFLRTQDSGLSWQIVSSTPIIFLDLIFLDNNEGYGIGFNKIYKTEDGGETWIKDYENDQMVFISIAKTPSKTLFVVTDDGIILKLKK